MSSRDFDQDTARAENADRSSSPIAVARRTYCAYAISPDRPTSADVPPRPGVVTAPRKVRAAKAEVNVA
jgi:hypothetical protein